MTAVTPPDEPLQENTPPEVASEAVSATDLAKLLKEAQEKAAEQWEQMMRTRAEMENLRRRHDRDLEGARRYALDSFVSDLLPVWDSLALGLVASGGELANLQALREGTELTLKLFGDVMHKFGVVPVEPTGQVFNPDLHQAMAVQPRDDVVPNTVVTVIQRGYTLNGRLVRPALVMVAQSPPQAINEQA
ncbi:MAG: nucleotide exchange factor GrpE [Pseudomonadota bacterium]